MRKSLAVILLLISMTACANEAVVQETVLYRSVLAGRVGDPASEKVQRHESGKSPEFLVEGGEVFLRVQTTHTKWGLYTVVSRETWTPGRLARLTQEHPSLRTRLPTPSAADGGIAWLSKSDNSESK